MYKQFSEGASVGDGAESSVSVASFWRAPLSSSTEG